MGRVGTRARAGTALTGMQKAALFLLALGEEKAAPLIERMSEEELVLTSKAMAELGVVDAESIRVVAAEFVDRMRGGEGLVGDAVATERVLRRSLPAERVDAIMEELRGPAGRTIWEKLGNVSSAVIATYLKNEYPQTVALVLSRLRPEKAAEVLPLLPESFAVESMLRMLRMESVGKETLAAVESTLKVEFMSVLGRTNRLDPHERMAEMMNALTPAHRERFLSSVEERNRESAERIRRLMFTFDDLVRVSSSDLATLLREIPRPDLIAALRGAPPPVVAHLLSGLSARARRLLDEEMAALAPMRRSAVEEARQRIVVVAKELAGAGRIAIADDSGEDVWIG